jgi:ABC-type dipeptide/oligopeptide/nickel transport system permease subunit
MNSSHSKPSDSSPRRASPYPVWVGALAWASLAAVVGLTLLPFVLPSLDPFVLQIDSRLVPPFAQIAIPLGTDDLGRNLLARLSVGAQISLTVGLATAVVSVGMGGMVGLLAGLKGGWLDTVLMRSVDVLYSLPGLMVIILFAVLMEPTLLHVLPPGSGALARLIAVIAALAFFSWPDTARLIRGQTLSLLREQYVEAYQSLGGGTGRLVLKHLLPNLVPLLLLSALITVPRAILTESTLSFIGLGMEPPYSSWGTLASEGWYLVRLAPWLLALPSGLILLTMVSLNLLGEQWKQRLA